MKRLTITRTIAATVTVLAVFLGLPLAGDVHGHRRLAYDYTLNEVVSASEQNLEHTLAPVRAAGGLNRETAEWARLKSMGEVMISAAHHHFVDADGINWKLYLVDSRMAHAYSRAGGQIVLSSAFFSRYQPDDAELAFIIGHEIAHVLCEHE